MPRRAEGKERKQIYFLSMRAEINEACKQGTETIFLCKRRNGMITTPVVICYLDKHRRVMHV